MLLPWGVVGIIVSGDLNMPKIYWENFSSPEGIDQLFLDLFSNFEIEQLNNSPTVLINVVIN